MLSRREVIVASLLLPFQKLFGLAHSPRRSPVLGQHGPSEISGVEIDSAVTLTSSEDGMWAYLTIPPSGDRKFLSGAFVAQCAAPCPAINYSGQAKLTYWQFGGPPFPPPIQGSPENPDRPYLAAFAVASPDGGGFFFELPEYFRGAAPAGLTPVSPLGLARYWWKSSSKNAPTTHEQFVREHPLVGRAQRPGRRPLGGLAMLLMPMLQSSNCSNCDAGGPGSVSCSYSCVNDGNCTVNCSSGFYACCGCIVSGGTNKASCKCCS